MGFKLIVNIYQIPKNIKKTVILIEIPDTNHVDTTKYKGLLHLISTK